MSGAVHCLPDGSVMAERLPTPDRIVFRLRRIAERIEREGLSEAGRAVLMEEKPLKLGEADEIARAFAGYEPFIAALLREHADRLSGQSDKIA